MHTIDIPVNLPADEQASFLDKAMIEYDCNYYIEVSAFSDTERQYVPMRTID